MYTQRKKLSAPRYIKTRIGYSTIETKEAARIGYNGFLFQHEYSGEGRPSPEYECGKRNPLCPIRAASFVSIVLYPIHTNNNLHSLYMRYVSSDEDFKF